mgnify:CR=1 FL=1
MKALAFISRTNCLLLIGLGPNLLDMTEGLEFAVVVFGSIALACDMTFDMYKDKTQ